MAGLYDKVRRGSQAIAKGPNGVLQEAGSTDPSQSQTPPNISQLSGQAGLQAPPIDPMSAASIGANANQQKMMGSPAQTQNALRIANEPGQTLQSAETLQTDRTKQTSTEQQETQKSQALQQLGPLGDRVNDLINAQRDKLGAAAGKGVAVQAAPNTLQGIPTDPQKLTQLKDAAKALMANPMDQNLLLQVNTLLGRDPSSTIDPAQMSSLYESSVDSLSRGGADVVSNSLTVDDLAKLPAFGYDLQSLGKLLDTPPEQLGKFTIPELQQKLSQVHDTVFSTTAQLQQKANSGELGGAERALARQAGREASTTGVRASESDMNHLAQQIANADQVQFNGKTYAVEDLLKDETISGTISEYLNAPAGSDVRKQLEKNEPALVSFINKNGAVLTQAANQMAHAEQQFKSTNERNQAVSKIGNTTLDPEVMKAILPGYGQLATKAIDTSRSPVFNTLMTLKPDAKEAAAKEINALAADPNTKDTVQELAGLRPDQIKALHLEEGANSPAIKALTASRAAEQQLSHVDPNDTNAVLSLFTGTPGMDAGTVQRELTADRAAGVLGLSNVPKNAAFLDADGDGKLDPPASLLQKVKDSTPHVSLARAPLGVRPYQAQPLQEFKPNSPLEQTIYSKLSDSAADGKISGDDFRTAKFSEDNLYDLQDSGLVNKWGKDASDELQKELSSYRDTATTKAEGSLPDMDAPAVSTALDMPAARSVQVPDTQNADGSWVMKNVEIPSQEQMDSLGKQADNLTDVVKKWKDTLADLQQDPRAVRRLNLKDMQDKIDKYQSVLDRLQSRRAQLKSNYLPDTPLENAVGESYGESQGSPPEGASPDLINKVGTTVGGNSIYNTITNPIGSTIRTFKRFT